MALLIGSHVSFTKDEQLLGSVKEAISYGANSFMFYTGAPQNTNRGAIDQKITEEAHILMKGHNINNVFVHAPYIMNLANTIKEDIYQFSIQFLKDEIKRCILLGIKYIIVHPGNHIGLGTKEGINNIIEALNRIIEPDQPVVVCLELMAGKGSECGSTFEELKMIIDNMKYPNKVGICLDTCHLNDAGYDLSDFDNILNELDTVVGLDRLKVIHINDSKNIKGSHKDRHENIGYGTIGFDNLINIIYHPKLKNIAKILETPFIFDEQNNLYYPPYKHEIEMIRSKEFNNKLIDDIKEYYQKQNN